VVSYKPEEHGLWEIYKNEFDALGVRQVLKEVGEAADEENESFLFPIEANLRDFLIKNLHTLKGHKLKLYVDENQRDGKEYPTEVGPIDILTVDGEGNFIVFELKLSRGADKAVGQLLRYMGWVKQHLAKGKEVLGVVVANRMDEKIKYAVSATNNITLYEYLMKFELEKIS
jgi:RecB family endonuclease NucS